MDHLPSPFSPFYTNPRTVILSERAKARDAKDLLMRRLALSARGNDQPSRHPQRETPATPKSGNGGRSSMRPRRCIRAEWAV